MEDDLVRALSAVQPLANNTETDDDRRNEALKLVHRWFASDRPAFLASVDAAIRSLDEFTSTVSSVEVLEDLGQRRDILQTVVRATIAGLRTKDLQWSLHRVDAQLWSMVALYFARMLALQRTVRHAVVTRQTDAQGSIETAVAFVNDVKDAVERYLARPVASSIEREVAEAPSTPNAKTGPSLLPSVASQGQDLDVTRVVRYHRQTDYPRYVAALKLLDVVDEPISIEVFEDDDRVVDVFVPIWTAVTRVVRDTYVASHKLSSLSASEWSELMDAGVSVYRDKGAKYGDLQTLQRALLDLWYAPSDGITSLLNKDDPDDVVTRLRDDIIRATSVDSVSHSELVASTEDHRASMIRLTRLVQIVDAATAAPATADLRDYLSSDWVKANSVSRSSVLDVLVDVAVAYAERRRNGADVLRAIRTVDDNKLFRRRVDDLIKRRSAASVITYVKVRNTGVEDYNRRFNVLVPSDSPDLLLLQINEDDQPYYGVSDDGALDVTEYPAAHGFEVYKESFIERPRLYADGGRLRVYDRSYVFGKFHRVFLPVESNRSVAQNMGAVIGALRAGKTVFMMGYGASGAGKTSTLVYLNQPTIPVEERNGVFVHLCDQLASEGYGRMAMWVHEFYADPEEPSNRSYQPGQTKPMTITVDKSPDGGNGRCFSFVARPSFVFDGERDLSRMRVLGADRDGGDDAATEPRGHRSKHVYRATPEVLFELGQPLGEIVVHLVDTDRFVKATTNNPNSSRSHTIVFVELYNDALKQTARIAIGDFAGVENVFLCERAAVQRRFATVRRQSGDDYYYRDYLVDVVHGGGGSDANDDCARRVATSPGLWDLDLAKRRPHPDAAVEKHLRSFYADGNFQYVDDAALVLRHVFEDADGETVLELGSQRIRKAFDGRRASFEGALKNAAQTHEAFRANAPAATWELFRRRFPDRYELLTPASATEALDRLRAMQRSHQERLASYANAIAIGDPFVMAETGTPVQASKERLANLYDTGISKKMKQGVYTYEARLYVDCVTSTPVWLAPLGKKTLTNDTSVKTIGAYKTTVTVNDKPINISTLIDQSKTQCDEREAVRASLDKVTAAIQRIEADVGGGRNGPPSLKDVLPETVIQRYRVMDDGNLDATPYETLNDDVMTALSDGLTQLVALSSTVSSSSLPPGLSALEAAQHVAAEFRRLANPERTKALAAVYDVVENLLLETSCVLENARFVCENRRVEGYFINRSLRDLRAAVNAFLQHRQRQGINLTPATAALCDDQHCRGRVETRACWQRDALDARGADESVLMNALLREFHPDASSMDALFDRLVVCVFCVLNITKDAYTNNPPPVPYVDVNGVKRALAHEEPEEVVECAYAAARAHMTEYDVAKTVALSEDPALTALDKRFVNKQPSCRAVSKRRTKPSEAVVRDYLRALETFDNHNAASALGTLEYVDRLSKFNATDVVCTWQTAQPGEDADRLERFAAEQGMVDVLDARAPRQ